MDVWAKLLGSSPYIAMIIALGVVVIYLYKARETAQAKYEQLQTKFTNDMVAATAAVNALSTEYLKRIFADSGAWQDRFREFSDTLKDHTRSDAQSFDALDRRQEDIAIAIKGVETQLKATELTLKATIDTVVDRLRPR